ncbi:hypothetical protein Tco_0213686, partial [Tanacetum coccineum]
PWTYTFLVAKELTTPELMANCLGDDASKQGRIDIGDINTDAEITLIDETQGRINDIAEWIRRIGNWSNAFSCEVLAQIRRISLVEYGVLVKFQQSSNIIVLAPNYAPFSMSSQNTPELLHLSTIKQLSRKAHLLEDKQIPSVGVFDEVFLALGWHLEEIQVTWFHLEKKWMRLRTCTKIHQEVLFLERGDGVAGIKRCRRDLSGDGVWILCMTRSSTKELFTPFKDMKREFRSSRKHFKTLSLDESRSPDFDLFSDQEEYSEEEVAETMAETMEQYMSKTRDDYGSGIARPKIEDKDSFELKGQFLKELRDNTFSGSDHEDANEYIKKVLEIMDLFHMPNIIIDQAMLRAFPMSLTEAASRWLRNKPSGSITTWEDLKTTFLRKYYPPARTAKKIEEIINFQQEPNENLYQAWKRFKELLMKKILDSRGAIPSKTAADAKVAVTPRQGGIARHNKIGVITTH